MRFCLQTGLLAGTIIGAGVFSLPFVFSQSGISLGFIYLILGAAASIFLYFMYADIVLKTGGDHRFVGYAGIYLGKPAFWFSILMTIVEMIFVLTIYLILSASFIGLLLPIGAAAEKIMIFWFLGSAAIFSTVRKLAWLEFLITGGIIAIMLLVFVFSLPELPEWTFSVPELSSGLILLPLAPILFSLSGRVAIPTMIQYAREKVRKAIVAGVLLPTAIYAIFILSVIGLSGSVSEDAVSGLIGLAPAWLMVLIGVLGILSLFSSYVTVGLDVKNSLLFDLKMPTWMRTAIIVAAPLILYFAGFQSFIGLVSFVGGVFLALEAFFIIAMWRKLNGLAAPGKKTFFGAAVLVLIVFGLALASEILKIL